MGLAVRTPAALELGKAAYDLKNFHAANGKRTKGDGWKNFLASRNINRCTADRRIRAYEESVGLRTPRSNSVVDNLSTSNGPQANATSASEHHVLGWEPEPDLADDSSPAASGPDCEDTYEPDSEIDWENPVKPAPEPKGVDIIVGVAPEPKGIEVGSEPEFGTNSDDACDLAFESTPEQEFRIALENLKKAARKLDSDYVRQAVTDWLETYNK
jgi:hypothetical protein